MTYQKGVKSRMSAPKRLPLTLGGIVGLLAGGAGTIQVLAAIHDFEARKAAFASQFPPGYTGFRDGTNLIRGGEFYFFGTAAAALGVVAALMIIAATISAIVTRQSSSAVLTTLIAGAICAIIYVAASVIAVSTGLHPIAPYHVGVLQSLPGCFTLTAIGMFALAWMTGLLGAGLGSLLKPIFIR